MNKSVLISIRLPTTLLNSIDEIAKSREYLNRSKVIQHAMTAMVLCTELQEIYDVMNCYDPFGDGIKIKVLKKTCN